MPWSCTWRTGAFAAILSVCAVEASPFADETAFMQTEVEAKSAESKNGQRQMMRLDNWGDAQYIATMQIGGQTIKGIFDTGSFDLVVFPETCDTCGVAGKYNPTKSRTAAQGILSSSQSYGSGDTSSVEAFDLVNIAELDAVNQTFWTVEYASMPLLGSAAFNAIVGVGPPETPASDAWGFAKTDIDEILEGLERGTHVAPSLITQVSDSVMVASEVSTFPALLDNMGMKQFSICIGAAAGSPGYVVWNDDIVQREPEKFSTMPVVGHHTWSVQVHNAELSNPHDGGAVELGCADGCSALIDSGTSLLAVPKLVYRQLETVVTKLKPDCSNINELPDLVFMMGNLRINLPPSSYVAELTGSVPTHLQSFVRVRNRVNTHTGARGPYTWAEPKCQLFVMELKSESQFGSSWILGLPIFRKYYAAFNVGTTMADRTVSFAPADDNCKPTSGTFVHKDDVRHEIKSIELSKLYVPKRVLDGAGGETPEESPEDSSV